MKPRLAACACLTLVAAVAALPTPAVAHSEQPVQFAEGSTSTMVKGSVHGRAHVDHIVNVQAGQQLAVAMTASNSSAYFNLIAPDQTDVAFYVGSNSDPLNRYEGMVPVAGNIRVRVYLYRAAARRNENADYRLTVSVNGKVPDPGPPGDVIVPGTDFHATGDIPCSTDQAAPARCAFGVRRAGGGSGRVEITSPNGTRRTIVFEGGNAKGIDQSEAHRAPFSARKEGDDTIIRIGNETYVIPDAVVFGG